jgi:hypothetical protein
MHPAWVLQRSRGQCVEERGRRIPKMSKMSLVCVCVTKLSNTNNQRGPHFRPIARAATVHENSVNCHSGAAFRAIPAPP